MLNVLLLMEPSSILIQGIDGIPLPPIKSRCMEKASVPIPFHKPVNSRFQYSEIHPIPKSRIKILKKLMF